MLNPHQISIETIPKILFLVFLWLFFLFLFNTKIISKQFKKIKKKTWLILVLVVLLGAYFRFFFAPHHFRVLTDEPGHIEAAKNILQHTEAKNCEYLMEESCEPYKRQLGWPLLLSFCFLLFGVNNYIAINLSALFGSLSITLLFLFTYLLFKKESIALWSSLLLCLTPAHIIWSGTAEPNVASLFFLLLTLLFFMVCFREGTLKTRFLAVFSLLFTLQMRSEFLLLLPVLFLLWLFFGKKTKPWWLPWLVFIVFLPTYLIQLYFDLAANLSISGGGLFNIFNLFKNAPTTLGMILNDYNLLFVVSLFLGLYLIRQKKKIFIPLLAFFLVFFLLYSSFQRPQTRMFLAPIIPLILFSAYGLDFLTKKFNKITLALVVLLMLSFYPSLAGIEAQPFQALETKVPQLAQKDIPADCYILTEWPETLACTTDFKLVDSTIPALNQAYIGFLYNKTDCVLFYEDIYCLKHNSKKCTLMHEAFNLTQYKNYSDFGVTYSFYKVPKKV